MAVIDVHTHMFGNAWLDMLKKHGGTTYESKHMRDGRDYLVEKGSPACAFEVEAFDYAARVKQMDRHGIDVAIVSLTSPNVHWGGPEISAQTARLCNDEMAEGQAAHPDRIRWFASIPWEYPDAALAELERAIAKGAAGVMVIANINGKHLIDPLFTPVWKELDRLAFPVLLHPTAPFGAKEAEFGIERILMPGAGFMYDTTLAVSRMAVDGFLDRHSDVKIIVSHGGGYLPFIAGRLDVFFNVETLVKMKIVTPPSEYLSRLYYDAIVYDKGALDLVVDLAGPDKVLFGTDLPMPADPDKLYAVIASRGPDEAAAILGGNAARIFGL
jgi:aminocarboxymuconate-semialdehyde decarboxylase